MMCWIGLNARGKVVAQNLKRCPIGRIDSIAGPFRDGEAIALVDELALQAPGFAEIGKFPPMIIGVFL